VASPQQRSRPHSTECAAVSHEKQDDNGPHSPYSPDLAPNDFFLFPRMKRDLKGKRFQNVEEVREKSKEALKAINLQEYQNCFEQWKKLWDKCIASQGEYFEGD
jgi:predicted acetyltransferase